jgi:hypothetical protein
MDPQTVFCHNKDCPASWTLAILGKRDRLT